MCGIAGYVNLREDLGPPEIPTLSRMAAALAHRGPDEFGVYRDARAGLAHSRLSIIDLATGQQPMAGEGDRAFLVFNGEIFNYVELAKELAAKGRVFRTKSDTEVILAAWEAWGEACFDRFNGQWAIALWEPERRRLVLSRDRLGVRPLHVTEHEGRLYFASEVKAIFAADRSIPRAFEPMGLAEAFTFWAPVAPRTPFRGVREVEPGTFEVFDLGRSTAPRARAYWRPRFLDRAEDARLGHGSVEAAAEDTLASLEKATHLRIVRADVPVGSYLSGGLDSSLIAALGLRAKGERFKTFSLRFADAEYDETEFQDLMARSLGSDHASVEVSRADIAEVFPDVVYHAERPLLRTAPAPLFLLSRLVRQSGTKVVLTGEGADEMFGGYDLFREGKVRRFWARAPSSKIRPRLLERLYPYLARSPVGQRAIAMSFFGRGLERADAPGFAHDLRWQGGRALLRLLDPGLRAAIEGRDVAAEFVASLPEDFHRWAPLAQDQLIEFRTLLSSYLLSSQGDRMLMANSVEGRFPFLDRDVVELAGSLPSRFKLRVLDEKHVLKRAAAQLVPRAILERKKQPYRAPDALSFVGDRTPAWIEEALSPRAVREAGVFDPATIDKLFAKCRASKADQFSNADNMALVGALSTQLLHARLVAAAPPCPDIELTTRIDRGAANGSAP